jgi:hypothetical protein
MTWVVRVENASNAPYTLSLDRGFFMTDSSRREYRDVKSAQCGEPLGGDAIKGPVTLLATQSAEFGINLDANDLGTTATYLELHLSVAGKPLTFRYPLR